MMPLSFDPRDELPALFADGVQFMANVALAVEACQEDSVLRPMHDVHSLRMCYM